MAKKDEKKNDAQQTPKKAPVQADKPAPSQVEKGHRVSVEYTGKLENGDEFDSSKNNGPITFIVGGGQVIKGFDDAVVGMKTGESKNIKIKKEDAYGDVNPQLMQKIPLDRVPEDVRKQVKVGGFLVMQSPVGQQIPAKVESVTDKEITLDLNHPLAGKDLNFELKVVDIAHPTEEDLHAGHDHSGHDHGHHHHDHGPHHHDHDGHGHNHDHGEDCDCDDGDCDCESGECDCK